MYRKLLGLSKSGVGQEWCDTPMNSAWVLNPRLVTITRDCRETSLWAESANPHRPCTKQKEIFNIFFSWILNPSKWLLKSLSAIFTHRGKDIKLTQVMNLNCIVILHNGALLKKWIIIKYKMLHFVLFRSKIMQHQACYKVNRNNQLKSLLYLKHFGTVHLLVTVV